MNAKEKREYHRAYHHKRSPEAKTRKMLLQKERAARTIKAVREFKEKKGCMDCGEKDSIVLEFDHRDASKKAFTIGERGRIGGSLKKILLEAEKCDVVCANCHRRRTAKQFSWRM